MPILQPNTKDQLDMSKIPNGSYPSEIKAVQAKTSAKGNPMVEIDVDVIVDGKPRGRKVWLVVTGAGSGGFDNLLRACGFDGLADRYKAGEEVPFDTDSLIGQRPIAVIGEEEYENEMRDRIKKFLKP